MDNDCTWDDRDGVRCSASVDEFDVRYIVSREYLQHQFRTDGSRDASFEAFTVNRSFIEQFVAEKVRRGDVKTLVGATTIEVKITTADVRR